jgi:manganese/iron transport system ATP-binding protein
VEGFVSHRSLSASLSEVHPSISLKDVSVIYANGHLALDRVSFELKAGSIYGLVGMNGSGKSTIFKSLMGFLTPASGSIRLCGLPVREALRRQLVAYVPQAEEVDWNYPVLVEDVVMMGRYGHMNFLRIPSRLDRTKVEESLARVGMADFRKRQIGELSGGQKKRVFLARALAQQSRIVLLDEPFTGVDVKTESAITALLEEIRDAGGLVLVSTHNLGSVPEFCDQAILLNRAVLAVGPTAEVFTPARLELAFGGALRRFRLPSDVMHADDDERSLTVLTDDERPAVFYGDLRKERNGRKSKVPSRGDL